MDKCLTKLINRQYENKGKTNECTQKYKKGEPLKPHTLGTRLSKGEVPKMYKNYMKLIVKSQGKRQ